ncbi:hypothetical protein TrST_g9785 [Triparma strigata]|uniref:Uncharacterized protein n=1 Tax=Triparma strigata TaxID=1606541 RepID=A0A9W7EUF2_9STRA|nr:hypothetical protein TrST_g9785 [Triparma strigata]
MLTLVVALKAHTPSNEWTVNVRRLNRRSVDKTLLSQDFTGSSQFLLSEKDTDVPSYEKVPLDHSIQTYVNRSLTITSPYTITFSLLWSPTVESKVCSSPLPITLLTFTPGRLKNTPTLILNPSKTPNSCSKLFLTSLPLTTSPSTPSGQHNEVSGFISTSSFVLGWNVVQLSYDNSVLIGFLNNVKIGSMTSKQFKEPDFGRDRYLKVNAEHVVVRDVVWTQGWSRPDFRGGEDEIASEGGVREYVRGEVGLEEVRRGINYKIVEGKANWEDRILMSYLTYTGDFGKQGVPYYLTDTGSEEYTNLYSGICSSSLKDLKEVAEESFREFSQGNSKAVRSQVIRDLGKGEEERVEYFRGEGERGNLWLAQSYYWGNNELQQDFGEARRHFEMAAAEGGAINVRGEALYNLGVMHANGQIPAERGINMGGDVRALGLWEEGAALGDLNCMVGLGGFYLRGGKLSNGTAVERNGTMAKEMYEKAREGGSLEAEEMLGKGWVWGWWGKIDYKKGLVHLAVCAGREKDGCLLELGKGIGEKDGWVSRMGREIDKGVGEVVELGGFEVFTNNGRRYISVNNFEVPLGYDCYVARRYLLAVATRGPWVHSALELGIEKYLEGDDGEAMFLWSKCAMMGATVCAELAFEIMDGVNAEGGVAGGEAFFKDGSRDGLERARMANWRRELRLKMANDDHARSVGWLGDCYWGGVSNAVGCEVNRTLAMRLYEEGTLLFDDRSTWNEGLGWFFGNEEGGVIRNVTKGKEKLTILFEEKQPGFVAAGAALVGIEIWMYVEGWIEWLRNFNGDSGGVGGEL